MQTSVSILTPSLQLLSFCLFILSNSTGVFVYCILLYYCSLEACLFSNERQKGSGPRQKGTCVLGVEVLGGVEGWDFVIRIYYVRKSIFDKRKYCILRERKYLRVIIAIFL